MFTITCTSPFWNGLHTFTTDDLFAWLDRAFEVVSDLQITLVTQG